LSRFSAGVGFMRYGTVKYWIKIMIRRRVPPTQNVN
jgi:hypothetical protein